MDDTKQTLGRMKQAFVSLFDQSYQREHHPGLLQFYQLVIVLILVGVATCVIYWAVRRLVSRLGFNIQPRIRQQPTNAKQDRKV